MNSKQTKIIFTGIIILFLLFVFIYTKSFEEFFFNETENLIVEINRRNNILLINDSVEVIDRGNLLHASDELIISNQVINKNYKFNGFIFKLSNFSNLKIGFKSQDNKDIDYHFNILGNRMLSIIENNKQIDIDFCSIESIKKCNFKKNTYSYNSEDYLGILFMEDNIIYFSIKSNEKSYSGNIIHKSLEIPKFPLKLCILNDKNDNLIQELYWVNNKYSSEPNKWSLEILQNTEDNEMPPQETLTSEEKDEGENIKKIFKFDKDKPWIKKIFIIDHILNRNNNILNLTCITNMSETEMKFLKDIYINIIIKIDGEERILNIPYNKYIITSDREYENKLVFKLDISKYVNYFNYDLSCKVELVRSKTIQDKNIISNIVKL